MNEKQIERLKNIHLLIQQKKTGSPIEFAKSIKVSVSHLYNILEDLKDKGFPIKYNRTTKSYFYLQDCNLEINYSVQLLTAENKILYSNVIRV